MVLDGVLAEPETTWLATPHEKVEHFSKVTSLPPEKLPRRGASDQEGPRRAFPDALPIGCARDDQPYVFLYLVTGENPIDFRGFLHRHQGLLRVLPRWEIRLLVPDSSGGERASVRGRRHRRTRVTARPFGTRRLALVLRATTPGEHRACSPTIPPASRPCDAPSRFSATGRSTARGRTRATCRLYEATSPLLSAAMEVEEGRVTSHVLPHDYLRLTTLVGTA